jgi:hypothetical protein
MKAALAARQTSHDLAGSTRRNYLWWTSHLARRSNAARDLDRQEKKTLIAAEQDRPDVAEARR